jgi:uncharacterized protein with ParB-like and HNH nuclease domain
MTNSSINVNSEGFDGEEVSDEIVMDSDFVENEEEGNQIYPNDLRGFDLGIRPRDFSVFEIVRRYEEGRIILAPDFQREVVWDVKKMSRFIETVLIGVPVPPLYFNETIDSKFVVIDGLQRISSLLYFLGKIKEDKLESKRETFPKPFFKLTGLQTTDLNGLNYNDLSRREGYQARITDTPLTVYVIKPSVKMPVIYDIFDRINTGGTILNKQEVRNALFAGKSTALLKKLVSEEYFLKAIDNGISDKRMKARESVLRILCFILFDYKTEYKGSLGNFLDNGMLRINKMTDKEIVQLEKKFERVMLSSFDLFGKSNFRFKTNSKSVVNLAVMDAVCNFLNEASDDFLEQNKMQIRDNYKKLLVDVNFKSLLEQGTGTKSKLFARFEYVKQKLSELTTA